MTFNYEWLPKQTFEVIKDDCGRRYKTPIGELYSVTEILSKALGTKKLDDWRERIGDFEADQIQYQARHRGKSVHEIFEQYLKGENWRVDAMPVNCSAFLKVKPFIDKNLTKIFGIEHQLYSEYLMCAGTADLIAEFFNRYRCIVDFKTAKRRFKRDDDRMLKYRLQATTYAMMVEKQHELMIPYNIVIIIIDDEIEPDIDISLNITYRPQVTEIFRGRKWLL